MEGFQKYRTAACLIRLILPLKPVAKEVPMPRSADRREFLQTISLGGTGLVLLTDAVSDVALPEKPAAYQIENQFFGASFNKASGTLQVWRKDGTRFLVNAIARAETGNGIVTTADPEYSRTIQVKSVADALGSGRQVLAVCAGGRHQLDLEVRVTLYDGRNAIVVETVTRNSTRRELVVRSTEPVRATFEEGGACYWPGATRVLTNGYMYYDPGHVDDFGRIRRRSVASMWNMGFYRGEDDEGLVIGYVDNDVAEGRISAWYDETVRGTSLAGGFALVSQSLYNREMVLKPGASISSGRLIFNLAPDPFTALESYAQTIGDAHKVRLNSIVSGWCNWFYTHEYVTEEEIVRNAEFAARHLKPFGLEFIQIDGGYQRAYGEWEGGENFPHGMKWLARKIREFGLKPGIWVAPYCITEGTEVHQKHPEWLVRNLDGGIKLCREAQRSALAPGGYGLPSFMRNIYGLDITHPVAAEWVRRLFEVVAQDWGYEFIKIDFVEWTLLAAERYHDPGFSKAAAYRKGFEIIREAIGPKRHLLDCGPMNETVGLLDSTRIELDLAWLNWQQYVKNSNSNAPAMAKRYYFHKRTWINDDDHLGLALLSIPQAQAAASIIALSGGTMISGDRLIDLDPVRLEILRKVFPSSGEAARPVDLFERDKPEIFALEMKRNHGNWLLVGIFNYDEEASAEKQVSLKRLRLDPSLAYVAFEFWSQQLQGEVRDTLQVRLEPSSLALLALHQARGTPQVVSTDRHFTQGGVELESVLWDPATNTLRGVSLGPLGSAHNVAIYIPGGYRWAEPLDGYFKDFTNYSLKLMEPRLLRMHVQFEKGERVPWEVKFNPQA
jgi:hypothetical protein